MVLKKKKTTKKKATKKVAKKKTSKKKSTKKVSKSRKLKDITPELNALTKKFAETLKVKSNSTKTRADQVLTELKDITECQANLRRELFELSTVLAKKDNKLEERLQGEAFKQVIREGFFMPVSFDGGRIIFTTPEITLEGVVMGSYKVRVDLLNGDISVIPHRNNLRAESYEGTIHPFVEYYDNWSGSICWGNASEIAWRLQRENRIAPLLRLLQSLLTTYSAEGPYTRIETFERLRNQKDRLAATRKKKVAKKKATKKATKKTTKRAS